VSEVKANRASDWLKRWGLWILLGLALLLVVLAWLLPSDGRKPKLLQEAKDGAKKLKDAAEEKLDALTEEMDKREAELAGIEKIDDEEERLRRLAEFANRRG
jgi:flagellar biosynthesis/type III secretory pathway M-ring protein FliF/YscJ